MTEYASQFYIAAPRKQSEAERMEEAITAWLRMLPDIPTSGVFVRRYWLRDDGVTDFFSKHRTEGVGRGRKHTEISFRNKRTTAMQVAHFYAMCSKGTIAVVDKKTDAVLWKYEI